MVHARRPNVLLELQQPQGALVLHEWTSAPTLELTQKRTVLTLRVRGPVPQGVENVSPP